ncbi:MAG TPA: hypothetical protein VN853_00165 [Polyangia bacterium]|nr:hypothetical protein [Polyangia bacterium]
MRVRNWAWTLGLVALVAGCGNQMLADPVNPHPPGSVDAGHRLDAQIGPGGNSAEAGISPPPCTSQCCGFVPPSCPATLPTVGTPCGPPAGYSCEYGDDPNIACNTMVQCGASGWALVQGEGDQQAGCPTPASICPPSFPGAVDGGVACPASAEGFSCAYPEGVCGCYVDWSCVSFPNECPITRPRAGTPCNTDGGGCQTWGSDCGSTDAMRCVCGVWVHSVCILI